MNERKALAELVRIFDSGDGTIVAKTAGHVAFAAARAALAQPTVAVDEIAIDAWKLRMVYFNENGDPLMSREPEQSELRAAPEQPAHTVEQCAEDKAHMAAVGTPSTDPDYEHSEAWLRAQALSDERAAFDAWWSMPAVEWQRRLCIPPHELAWEAWQARALKGQP